MEQHPIPQAITTYKFKLVGDMTLKQFLELASGIVTAWIIFNSKINFAFKWTLGPIFAFFGFALAFLPIEDRPLDHWIISFIKAIYAPTQFLYRPVAKKLAIFEPLAIRRGPQTALIRTGQSPQLHEYLESLPQSSTSVFDQAEAKYLDYISNLFGALGNKILPITLTKDKPAPTLAKSGVKGIRVRQLSQPEMCLLPRAVIYEAPVETKIAAMPIVKARPVAKPQPVVAPVKPMAAPKPQPAPAPLKKPTPKPVAPPSPKASTVKAKQPSPAIAPQRRATVGPVFATDIVLPQKPERPNLIAGITLDKDGKIVPEVILEIRDSQGFPVRALKSNKLGQFFIATPLQDGIYELSAEHEGYKFAIIKLEAKNEIIPPLKIQAQS